MKTLFVVVVSAITLFTLCNHSAISQPHIYQSFVTHNEENEPYNNFNYYNSRRNIIVQLANYVNQNNAVWNFQSDWRFLQAVANFDTGFVIQNTNGKNLIRWLTEDMGVVCDPHAHETQYNYADIAYLHQQLGITPTKVVGGFLYNQIVNGNNWENLEQGIYGRVYTSYFWKPDILWGGGTPGHVNDPLNYGAWKPQSMANYFTHDTSKNLTLICNGCANKIFDTTSVTTALNRVRTLLNAYETGLIPDSGFYTSTVFMSVGQFNAVQLNKMKQFIDTLNIYASLGRIQWKTIQQVHDIWQSDYGKNPFRMECAQLPAGYSILNITATTEGFYDEFANTAIKDTFKVYLRNSAFPYSVVDSASRPLDSISMSASFAMLNAPTGNYYIVMTHRNGLETWSRAGGIPVQRGAVISYDFTSSSSQAYGNNLVQKGSLFCIYSGDVDNDGIIDSEDLSRIENQAFLFSSGYIDEDLTGDRIVDAEDMAIADNNAFGFVQLIRP